LFTRQSPQKLKVLREHALIESAISSNRIEGVEVDQSRVGTLLFGKPALRNREEEEVRGYRDALKLIHDSGANLPISEATIKRLHSLCRGEIWDAGQYKEKDVDIIQTYADGRSRVRFKTVAAKEAAKSMGEMIELWQRGLIEKWVHPFVLATALNLDFLCVHPFRDGNGRVSRLLFLLACYHCRLEVGRYVSLVNDALRDRPAGMTVGIHLCRGNNQGKWIGEGGYDAVAERIFTGLAVDAFFLEYDSPRAGSFAPLRFMPRDRHVVLGLVTSKTPALESADALAKRIDEASRLIDVARLSLSPQCGFASTAPGNPLTPADQEAKLRLVVETARRVWGS